jgi:hypothetical protein
MIDKKNRIEELQAQIAEKKALVDEYNAMQMALKLIINSEYGATANKYYVMYNPNVANAITAMGREIIQFMANVNKKYWYKVWHTDTELHEKMGIVGKVKQIKDTEFVSNYIDTDSLFVSFEPALKSCDWKGDEKEFIFQINKHRLEQFFKDALESYSKRYGVENIQDFELEWICESIIFLEKKRYVKNVVYEDGIHYNRLEYILPKGVELIKSSTPVFVREKLLDLMKYLLDTKHNMSISELNRKIRDIKLQFKLANVEEISSSISMSDYNKWILDDQSKYEYRSGTPSQVKAAAFHNFILNQNPELKGKYNLLKAGNKLKYYYCKDTRNEVFAFSRGMYPKEFAPPIDIDTQFEKTVLTIINMFTDVLGLPPLNSRLTFSHSLF